MSIGSAIVMCAVIAAVVALLITGHGHALLLVGAAVGAVAIFLILTAALS